MIQWRSRHEMDELLEMSERRKSNPEDFKHGSEAGLRTSLRSSNFVSYYNRSQPWLSELQVTRGPRLLDLIVEGQDKQ